MAAALRVALTGGIASGKTTVAELLAGHGAILIDSDLLSREVVEPGTPGLARVVERFGREALAPDGSLDRQALGRIVFDDEQARTDLNEILHPAVRARRAELMASAPDQAVVVAVIPLLVETGIADQFDRVVVVDVPVATQVERLMARNGYSVEEARARVSAQASREQRLAVADHVIDNSGTAEQTRAQVADTWQRLRRARSS